MLPSYHPKRFEHIMADVVFGRWAGQLRHLMRCSCVKTCGCARLFVRALSRKTIDTSRALACHPVYGIACVFFGMCSLFLVGAGSVSQCARIHTQHTEYQSQSPPWDQPSVRT